MFDRTQSARGAVIALCAAVALTLSACGGGAEQADSGTSGSGGAGDESGFPRTVENALGSTEIPAEPERIVTLDPSFTDAAITLGGHVVGYATFFSGEEPLPEYLGEDAQKYAGDAENLGMVTEPSLEKLAALQPDLILSAKVRHEDIADKLSKIAPTVMSETTGPTWKENTLLVGEAIGQEDAAKKKIAAYEKRAAAIGKEINAKAGDPTISVVNFRSDGSRLYQKASFIGVVLSDAGLARPPSQDVDDFAADFSQERIEAADADYIFVTATQADDVQKKFQNNPLWGQLKGKTVPVDASHWIVGTGLPTAHLVLDDLAETFGVDPQR